MTEPLLRAVFDKWIERLGLSHWMIEIVVHKFKPRTTTMQTTKSPHYDRGRVLVQPWVITGELPADWHKASDVSFEQEIERTVVHELLHLLLWETSSAICLLHGASKQSAYAVVVAVQEHQEEHFVDGLACALVKNWEHVVTVQEWRDAFRGTSLRTEREAT